MSTQEPESYSAKLNNLEERLSAFYGRIIPFIELQDAQPPVTESRYTETGEFISFLVHPGRIEEDKRSLEASYLLDIVSLIANLKDHIKSFLTKTGMNSKDFETLIDNNKYLAALVDLNNANKHGTPLRRPRICADVGLTEIRRSILMKSRPGRPTAMPIGSGPSVVTAWIDVGTEKLSFRVSVEKALEAIEDFIESQFPNKFIQLSNRVRDRKLEQVWVEKIIKDSNNVKNILSTKGFWKLVDKHELKPTMLISFEKEHGPDLPANMAYVVEPPNAEKDTAVKVFDLLLLSHDKYSLSANLYCFFFEKQSDAEFVFKHYQSVAAGFKP